MKSKDLHIIADCSDNSITLSSELCSELMVESTKITRIFVFQIKGTNEFAFKRVNSKFARRTECGIVSFNPVLKSFGFISLIPTVNMMFYTMGIDEDKSKLRIEKVRLPDDSYIYHITAHNAKGN